MELKKIITIGLYGFTEDAFFSELEKASVDTFCDIRYRRGVRGKKYSFANSKKLQEKLKLLNINYFHFKDLAPLPKSRLIQKNIDKKHNIRKSERNELSQEFIDAYGENCINDFSALDFIKKIEGAKIIALFCVEKFPKACHRSILAEKIASDLDLEIINITS